MNLLTFRRPEVADSPVAKLRQVEREHERALKLARLSELMLDLALLVGLACVFYALWKWAGLTATVFGVGILLLTVAVLAFLVKRRAG